MTDQSHPTASIVIPAHNEHDVIATCLETLLDEAGPGELEIVVVCNGCTDDTATIARSFGSGVRVLETAVPSKTVALNLGDQAVSTFPRLYLDADVLVDTESVRTLAGCLDDSDVLAAAPIVRMDTDGASWFVRSYYRVWAQMDWMKSSTMGSGCYSVSECGRARFDAFPDIYADDYWFNAQFAANERRRVVAATSVVRAAADLPTLIRRKARVLAYSRLVENDLADTPGPPSRKGGGLLDLARSQPTMIPLIAVYAGIAVVTNALAFVEGPSRRTGLDQ